VEASTGAARTLVRASLSRSAPNRGKWSVRSLDQTIRRVGSQAGMCRMICVTSTVLPMA